MQQEKQSQSDSLPVGTVVSNRYQIERRIGEGGMGCVYVATDRVLEGNRVALKVLHKDYVRDPEQTKRFLREVQLMHKVSHKHVVRTYDVGRDGNIVYFSMEFLEGASLDRLLRSGPFGYRRAVNIACQICEGLEAIHGADILHRDLKPANILLVGDDDVKIADFGVARPKASQLTQHNEIIGSVQYIAPELWLGQELTFAIDFYSFGVILYEMTTGQLPFASNEPATLLWMHVKRPPTPPISVRPSVPPWLNLLILKLLAKNPSDRPKTMGEVKAVLLRNASSLPADNMEQSGNQTSIRTIGVSRPATIATNIYRSGAIQTADTPLWSSRKTGKASKGGPFTWTVLLAIASALLGSLIYAVYMISWFLHELLLL